MEINFFTNLGVFIDSIFDFLSKTTNTDVVQILSSLVGLTITLEIMFKAYQSFAGKSSEPVKELVWDITIKLLIIGVALNLNGYLDVIKASMQELHNLAGGGVSLYSELDKAFMSTSQLSNALDDRAPAMTGWFYGTIPYIGFFIGAVPIFSIAVVTELTLKVLMLVLPIVIFLTAYAWFKNVFSQWLAIFLTNFLTVGIMSLLMKSIIAKFESFISVLSGEVSKSDMLIVGFQPVLMGILIFGITKLVVSLSEKLGQVGIESLSGQALKDSAKLSGTIAKVGAKNTITAGAFAGRNAMRATEFIARKFT